MWLRIIIKGFLHLISLMNFYKFIIHITVPRQIERSCQGELERKGLLNWNYIPCKQVGKIKNDRENLATCVCVLTLNTKSLNIITHTILICDIQSLIIWRRLNLTLIGYRRPVRKQSWWWQQSYQSCWPGL